jgi:hypothetical protein
VREVISHCIYGVNLNPLAVDLCKLALWLKGHWAGKPLSFLDHHIKCGNSLIGVSDPEVMKGGIPDEAFTPVTGDNKEVAKAFKKRNREERKRQPSLEFEAAERGHEFAAASHDLDEMADNTPEDVKRKQKVRVLAQPSRLVARVYGREHLDGSVLCAADQVRFWFIFPQPVQPRRRLSF